MNVGTTAPPTGTKRRAKGYEREEVVLRAAAQAISDLGLANVRVADVAERAGIGPGHVSYYFPSKNDLLLRAIRWSEQGLHDEISRKTARVTDPWKRMDKLFDLALSTGAGDPGWVLWLEVWSRASADPAVAAGSAEFNAWWRHALDDAIAYGVDQGSFYLASPSDAGTVVTLLSAVIDGLSIQLTLGAASPTRADALQICIEMARHWLSR